MIMTTMMKSCLCRMESFAARAGGGVGGGDGGTGGVDGGAFGVGGGEGTWKMSCGVLLSVRMGSHCLIGFCVHSAGKEETKTKSF